VKARAASSRLGALAVLVVAVPALAGCQFGVTMARPDCSTEDLSTLIVIAQSVHDASLVPCLQTIPAGWEFVRLEVREKRSRLELASDRGGDEALEVTLRPSCDPRDAVRIPSDERFTQRFERVDRLEPRYEGTRFYVFDGGCVTYRFVLDTAQPSGLLNEATLMVGFMTRAELREALREETHGVIEDGP
jgi:hypothetical protein